MAGLCAPLSTLRRCPRGHLRMTRGRCGSLLLHRDGLAPSTPCRSPGALRFTPDSDVRCEDRQVRKVPNSEVRAPTEKPAFPSRTDIVWRNWQVRKVPNGL